MRCKLPGVLTLAAMMASGCAMIDPGYGVDDQYPPPPAGWDDGREGDEAYRAIGTEPFWSVTIDDREMRYEPVDGPVVAVPTPGTRDLANGARYEHPRLTVTIVERACSDGMSDRRFPDTVIVQVEGRTLSGCGGGDASEREGDARPSAPPPGGRDQESDRDPGVRPDSADRLAGDWRVISIAGTPASHSTLWFGNGRLTGRSCNRLFGDYATTSRGGVSIARVGGTRMACDDDRMREEAALLAVLRGDLTISEAPGARLRLTGRGGTLVLAPR